MAILNEGSTVGGKKIASENYVDDAVGEAGGKVESVNGKTGIVVLDAEDIEGIPEITFEKFQEGGHELYEVTIKTPDGEDKVLMDDLTFALAIEGAIDYTLEEMEDAIEEHAEDRDAHGLFAQTVAIGLNSSALVRSVAIGREAVVDSYDGIAIGREATTTKDFGVSIGQRASSSGVTSIAIGRHAVAEAISGVSLGDSAVSENRYHIVLGTDSETTLIPGNFTVEGTKNFEIPHPHPDKRDTHRIRHGAVESPTEGDTLYRYEVEAMEDGETVELQLPDYFEYLNKDTEVWVNGVKHFGRAFADVEGDTLKVTCETAGKYRCLVIGTRNDDHDSVQDWQIKGVEREIGESWTGEPYNFTDDYIVSDNDEIFEEVI